MANIDLRNWIDDIAAAGELKTITGAEPKQEIGGIVDIYQRKMGNPAVMFDEVPGFPKGHRVLANILTSVKRINIALGLPAQGSEMELIQWWRNYMRDAPTHAPRAVNGGPLLENVAEGEDVDIEKIPTPVWHEQDGGPFIGTACMVVMKDPDSGWINYGCYRVQSQGPAVATVMMSPGKHGRIIMSKYHDRNEPCPVAVVAGMHPALFMLAGLEIPYGKSEFEAAGGILGEPVEVFNMPRTGLPVPANAEIAFEGHIHPGDLIQEGPLGEWTGLLRRRHPPGAGDPHRDLHAPRRPDPGRRDPGGAAQRQHLLSRHLPLRRRVEPARSGGGSRDQGRVGARSRRQPVLAHRLDQAALWRPRQAGRLRRLAVPRRRLFQPLDHRGRRRHRSDQHQRRDLGDVHALRSRARTSTSSAAAGAPTSIPCASTARPTAAMPGW